jgi:hypothetical protein
MNTTDKKLCKDCKSIELEDVFTSIKDAHCINEKVLLVVNSQNNINLVDGSTEKPNEYILCVEARNKKDLCGKDGKFYEAEKIYNLSFLMKIFHIFMFIGFLYLMYEIFLFLKNYYATLSWVTQNHYSLFNNYLLTIATTFIISAIILRHWHSIFYLTYNTDK